MGCQKNIPFLFWRKWGVPKTNSFSLGQMGDAHPKIRLTPRHWKHTISLMVVKSIYFIGCKI